MSGPGSRSAVERRHDARGPGAGPRRRRPLARRRAACARRGSSAWAATSSSIARIRSTCSRTVRAWRAAIGPIETWSSWLALVGIESADAGWARTLFSEARAAAVYWKIISPESSPMAGARNAGRPPFSRGVDEQRGPPLADRAELGDRELREVERQRDRLAVEVAAADDPAAAGRERVRRRRRRPSGKTSGLSVALFISMSRTRRRWSSASRTAPWTCGTQRSEYGSWTLWASPWWLVWSAESRSRWRSSAATAIWPGCGRASWYAAANATSVPEQRLDAHRRGDARGPRRAGRRRPGAAPRCAVISCVPLRSARPSFASSVERLQADLAEGDQRGHAPGRRARPGRAR